jgi:hypothetical protein
MKPLFLHAGKAKFGEGVGQVCSVSLRETTVASLFASCYFLMDCIPGD